MDISAQVTLVGLCERWSVMILNRPYVQPTTLKHQRQNYKYMRVVR